MRSTRRDGSHGWGEHNASTDTQIWKLNENQYDVDPATRYEQPKSSRTIYNITVSHPQPADTTSAHFRSLSQLKDVVMLY